MLNCVTLLLPTKREISKNRKGRKKLYYIDVNHNFILILLVYCVATDRESCTFGDIYKVDMHSLKILILYFKKCLFFADAVNQS